jgi:dTDP-4-dehydrorhamnose reductase
VRALVFGASGLLGRALVPELEGRGWDVSPLRRSHVDVANREAVRDLVASWRGDQVVNLAAYTAVDQAEREPERAFAVNRDGAGNVARAARDVGARLLHLSTDYVFDGRRSAPYPPDAHPSPLSVYGRSKLEGEEAVQGEGGHWLLVRTSWLYGAGGPNFVEKVLDRARRGERVEVVDDQRGRPTWTVTLAETLGDLLDGEARGTFHAGDGGDATWWELAREAFRLAGIEGEPERVGSSRFRGGARRPPYSVLDLSATEALLGRPAPHWKESLKAYMEGGTA